MTEYSYVEFTGERKDLHANVSTMFENLREAVALVPGSRELSLAMTKIDEAHMWFGRAIRVKEITATAVAAEAS